MHDSTYDSFCDELTKISAAKDAKELLSGLAQRVGVRPSMLPSITQVGNAAKSGNRQRAAEIARNVRGYLKEQSQR